jgi:hypothetical protein
MEYASQPLQVPTRHVYYTHQYVPVQLNSIQLPREDHVKYLGFHLTWRNHIFAKRKQLGLTVTKMHWLLDRKSLLSLSNKILLYKTILKPIWTYGIQLWGTASTFNVEILKRFQSKDLRETVDAPWYVSNTLIRLNLHMPTIHHYSSLFDLRLRALPNDLLLPLLESPEHRQLRRLLPNILLTRS